MFPMKAQKRELFSRKISCAYVLIKHYNVWMVFTLVTVSVCSIYKQYSWKYRYMRENDKVAFIFYFKNEMERTNFKKSFFIVIYIFPNYKKMCCHGKFVCIYRSRRNQYICFFFVHSFHHF